MTAHHPNIPSLTDFDLKLLRVFHAVVQAEGLAPAQETLGLSLSTISIKLKQLEERLGFTLCERGRKGFALTREGERIHASLAPLFDSITVFREVVADVRGNLAGELHIGFVDALSTFREIHLEDAFRRFYDMAPEVRLHIDISSPQELQQGLLDNRYHVIVTCVEPDHDAIAALPVFDEQQGLFCGCHHPLFDEQDSGVVRKGLESATFCDKSYNAPAYLREGDHCIGPIVAHMESAALLILSGRYVGHLPKHAAATWVRDGLMRELLPGEYDYTTHFYLAMRQDQSTRIADAFRQCMLEAVAS
jgi:DNA-binding transcriptional LysR family regulator